MLFQGCQAPDAMNAISESLNYRELLFLLPPGGLCSLHVRACTAALSNTYLAHFSRDGMWFAEGSSADYLDDPLYGHSRYRKLKDLNEGTFGIVVLAVDIRSKEQVQAAVDAP